LSELEVDSIWQEAQGNFFNHATLSEIMRQERQRNREHVEERAERFEKDRDQMLSDAAELHGVLLVQACEKAIQQATGEFADMLAQAVIARRGRKDFTLSLRAQIWAKCLDFAMDMASWENARHWADLAWGDDPLERPLPHRCTLGMREQLATGQEFVRKVRLLFEDKVKHGSLQWLEEADRKINLRCLLSIAPRRHARIEDPAKKAVALLLTASPQLSASEVCKKLDAKNQNTPSFAPIPKTWQEAGVRTWVEAYRNLSGRVRTYITGIRNSISHPS
jgi:hypothetical protein